VVGDAIQFIKRTEDHHEVNESSIQTLYWKHCHLFDDILIFSKNEREHQEHLTEIMLVLECEKLYGNLKRCSFFTNRVTILGYIVTAEGIEAHEANIKAIRS